MAQKILSRRDTTDTATTTIISLNSSTATKIVDAGTQKLQLIICNPGNQPIFIKMQAASVDNLKEGLFLGGKSNLPLVLGQGFYTGEVSAMSNAGPADVTIVRY